MKNKTINLFLLLLAGATTSGTFAQSLTYNFAATAGSGGSTDWANSVVTDAAGYVYVTGKFSGTVDFDPGTGSTTATSAGSSDIFLAKYDPSGALVWVSTYGAVGVDEGVALALDGDDYVYVTGTFSRSVDFDAGSGSLVLSEYPAYDRYGNYVPTSDVFLVKIDGNGGLVWAKNFGLPGWDNAKDVAVDRSGNVYLTGICSNDQSQTDSVDVDPGSGTTWFKSGGAFIAKYSSDGVFLHAGKMGRVWGAQGYLGLTKYMYNAEIRGTVVNSRNEFVAVGYFSKDVDFDMGTGTHIITATKSKVNGNSWDNNDGFFVTYDSNGVFKSVFTFGGNAAWCEFYDVALDANDQIHIAGAMHGTIDFNPSADSAKLTYHGTKSKLDAVILKYSRNGVFRWGSLLGGVAEDRANALYVDASGDVYSTGYFTGTADFNPGSGTSNLKSAGSTDIFISKLTQAGRFSWARRIGGTTDDMGRSIAVLQGENTEIYTGGFYSGTCDFNQESGTDNRTSNGYQDIYVHKLTQSGTEPAMSQIAETTAEGFIVFPNPFSDEFQIRIPENIGNVSATISAPDGRTLRELTLKSGINKLKLADMFPGIYILSIHYENGFVTNIIMKSGNVSEK